MRLMFSNMKINNIYIQRHAISCANIIEFGFNKEKEVMSKYAPDSEINYLGILQCLQMSDYLSNFRIDNIKGKKPLLIFCCSELIRTQQTLFLSWIKYLKDYKDNNGKILVIPSLNEVYKKNGNIILDKDNYPSTLKNIKKNWKKFIENIKKNKKQIKADTLNPKLSLVHDIKSIKNCELWDELFYISSNKKLNKIIDKYLIDQKIKLENYDGIELVLVTHFVISNNLIKYLIQSNKEYFLENSKIIKIPGECFNMKCIFPHKKIMENLLFIFYISKIDLFINVGNNEKELCTFLVKFNLKNYLKKLKNMKKYIQKLEKIYKNKSTFYNYSNMIQKIEQNLKMLENQNFQMDKYYTDFLSNYLFGFCELNQRIINSMIIIS